MSVRIPNPGGGDDVPPAWLIEDPDALDNLAAQDAQWLDEPLIDDEYLAAHPDLLDQNPDNASTVPHWMDGNPEDIEIFDTDRLATFGKAKKAAEDLRAVARGEGAK